jgi:hypothetical protein
MERINVSLVYGVEVPRGTPAAAFAGNAAVRFVRPHGATYPVVYASESAQRVDGVLKIDSLMDGRVIGSKMFAWARAISAACAASRVNIAPHVPVSATDCGWMVVCDVR